MRRALGPALVLLLGGVILAAAGCGPQNDLGSSCTLMAPVRDPKTGKVAYEHYPPSGQSLNSALDYISTGGTDCEDFTCVKTVGVAQPYCSRRCIDNASCQGGVNKNLVCRKLVLDDAFINELRQQLGPTAFKQLFGDIQTAKYCALPVPK